MARTDARREDQAREAGHEGLSAGHGPNIEGHLLHRSWRGRHEGGALGQKPFRSKGERRQ